MLHGMAGRVPKKDLVEIVDDFNRGASKLFSSRPYWLINESIVRSVFIEAALGQLRQDKKDIDARHICTEATVHGESDEDRGESRIDLVVRLPRWDRECRVPLIVEFKGWNIVAKYDDRTKRPKVVNASKKMAEAQWRSIEKDVEKLGRASKEVGTGLMVVYFQHALTKERAEGLAGRPLARANEMTILESIKEANKKKEIKDTTVEVFSSYDVKCEYGTKFSLVTFEVMHNPARGTAGSPHLARRSPTNPR